MILNVKSVKKTVTHIILILVAITTIFPFYWMIKTALTPNSTVIKVPPQLFEWPLTIDNFIQVFEISEMSNAILNSVFVSTVSVTGVLFSASMAAFAFSKLRFNLSKKLFTIIFATMLIPSQVTMIPLFIIFKGIGWVDTFLPLIIPQMLVSPYGIFLLRQFMFGIPDSYVEASKIDGAGYFKIYRSVVIPLCKPALLTLGMFSFVGSWNSFITPMIYLNSERKFTIPLIMNSFRTIYYVNWGWMMAAATVAVLPMFIIYAFVQKAFIQGIATTGIKG